MRNTSFVILAALLVTACNDGAQPAANVAMNEVAANEADATNYQAEVIALPVAAQEGVFLRAVRDARLACQKVTKSERLEDRQGNPTWRATCDGNNPHLISITRDGTAKIVSRTDAPRG
ncbi:hypothetical protein [Sphingomonas turrisvirgatae]|uniref:PepSY domain-containing protein n=1 Tax=Sphingomonas turrisvirgatae TaxID=1888892 RepID=A0A1E3M0I2_9SPHN|nr:hypothetical protein [Sphingomonas turrisvirgatae]ODP39493.1 hypothetical protein BFL28_10085 [Sphingomonas turrisvirgatae]